jgi:signal transduction histidine kinase
MFTYYVIYEYIPYVYIHKYILYTHPGLLELHKEEISVLPYLSDCLSMFTVQARECGVTMSIDTEIVDANDPADETSQMTIPLRTRDTVFMDKFKMNQVFRNLISNALKFTPVGGNVTMQAGFLQNNQNIERVSEARHPEGTQKRRNTEDCPSTKSNLRYVKLSDTNNLESNFHLFFC